MNDRLIQLDAQLDEAIEFAHGRKLGKVGRKAKKISKDIKADPYSLHPRSPAHYTGPGGGADIKDRPFRKK